jgi:hypothetical protein
VARGLKGREHNFFDRDRLKLVSNKGNSLSKYSPHSALKTSGSINYFFKKIRKTHMFVTTVYNNNSGHFPSIHLRTEKDPDSETSYFKKGQGDR